MLKARKGRIFPEYKGGRTEKKKMKERKTGWNYILGYSGRRGEASIPQKASISSLFVCVDVKHRRGVIGQPAFPVAAKKVDRVAL